MRCVSKTHSLFIIYQQTSVQYQESYNTSKFITSRCRVLTHTGQSSTDDVQAVLFSTDHMRSRSFNNPDSYYCSLNQLLLSPLMVLHNAMPVMMTVEVRTGPRQDAPLFESGCVPPGGFFELYASLTEPLYLSALPTAGGWGLQQRLSCLYDPSNPVRDTKLLIQDTNTRPLELRFDWRFSFVLSVSI